MAVRVPRGWEANLRRVGDPHRSQGGQGGVMEPHVNKRPRQAMSGVVAGVLLGVVLSIVLDSWAWMGAGIGIGLVLGGMPLFRRRTGPTQTPGSDRET